MAPYETHLFAKFHNLRQISFIAVWQQKGQADIGRGNFASLTRFQTESDVIPKLIYCNRQGLELLRMFIYLVIFWL